MPELIRPSQQRHVIGMLKVRQPNHPRQAMRAAEIVWDVELFQPQHAHTAAGEVMAGRSAHDADADDDDVEVALHYDEHAMMSPRRLYMDNSATSFPKPREVTVAIVIFMNDSGASAGRGAYKEAL